MPPLPGVSGREHFYLHLPGRETSPAHSLLSHACFSLCSHYEKSGRRGGGGEIWGGGETYQPPSPSPSGTGLGLPQPLHINPIYPSRPGIVACCTYLLALVDWTWLGTCCPMPALLLFCACLVPQTATWQQQHMSMQLPFTHLHTPLHTATMHCMPPPHTPATTAHTYHHHTYLCTSLSLLSLSLQSVEVNWYYLV